MSLGTVERRQRRANGLPLPETGPRGRWDWLKSPWLWVTVVATVIYAAALLLMYWDVSADRQVEGGVNPGLNWTALKQSAVYAAPTLAFWTLLFLVVDRYRPLRGRLWWLALGWGGAIATGLSLIVNSWAASHLAIQGDGDPASGERVAVFVAPFVEEASKASILFVIALLIRYRVVSKVSGVVLAGLSAAAFAFTENIIYYARVIVYATSQIGVGNADAAVAQLVFMRGTLTCFGHPLFTSLTGVGFAVSLRTHSKVVRVLAPLVGYCAAVLLHMTFNSQVGNLSEIGLYVAAGSIWLFVVLPAFIWLWRQVMLQGRLIRDRLTDYVRMGWLTSADPQVQGRLWLRMRCLTLAATRGWRTLVATHRLQRILGELAYLRDSEVKGLVDGAARLRARDLLAEAQSLRGTAIDNPTGLKHKLPRLPIRRKVQAPPPLYPGPAGLAGSWPAPTSGTPLGSSSYSPVDPRWGPPQ